MQTYTLNTIERRKEKRREEERRDRESKYMIAEKELRERK